jgi:hypothetical protein
MSNRVIVLEGPDGSGKSTLARRLQQRYNFKIVKLNQPKPKEDMLNTYTQTLWDALNDWRPVVFDRHYLGESIYGPVMRGEDRLTNYGQILIERMIAAYGVKLLVCLPGLEEGWAACQQRGEDFIKTRDQYNKIYNGFVREANRAHAATWNFYDERDDSLDDLMFSGSRVLPLGVTGSPTAEVLMVGERVNTNVAKFDLLPFHALTGCSPWFHAVVRETGLRESQAAWVNAFGSPTDLDEVLGCLPRLRRVISLGDMAGKVCCRHIKNGPPHYSIPHPQYWKRFFSKRRDEYVQMVRDAIGDL